MADGKIYITISDARTGEVIKDTNITVGKDPKKEKEKESEESLLRRYAEHELFHLVKNTVAQTVNFQISNIGNFTGDYITQRRVNEIKQGVSGLMSIAMATYAGAKFGPVGAGIGLAIGTASMISSSVFNVISTNDQTAKTNFNVSQLRERVGLSSTYDGSRGTEN